MPKETAPGQGSLVRDVVAGTVVFLVAIPLCLGIALASGAPLFSGLVTGIVGGIVVGVVSKSHTSVSGPAAGLTTIVAAQIASLGSFEAFLFAVVVAGVIQIIFGLAKGGFIVAFFPTSVIKGLLAAIGTILIIKQLPYVLGTISHAAPAGAHSGHQSPFLPLLHLFDENHLGAALIGVTSLALMMAWENLRPLKRTKIPGPLVVVAWGIALAYFLKILGKGWVPPSKMMVNVPVSADWQSMSKLVVLPDFSQWRQPGVYVAAMTLALVASLETLLNIEAVDKLDPKQRITPPSHELVAQGIGNVLAGLVGGLPLTSVVVRGSVNINAGGSSKLSAIFHGVLLIVFSLFLPQVVNLIPLSCLGAILIATGFKLVAPGIWVKMWKEGAHQFAPFALTVFAIVNTDLLIGVAIGLAMSLIFILNSNYRLPLKRLIERRLDGEVIRIELANQVSFLNRAAIEKELNQIPSGGHVLLDASNSVHIDPDVLGLIREFRETKAPARNIRLSVRGFRDQDQLPDDLKYLNCCTRDLQESLSPAQVIDLLREGNERFVRGEGITREARLASTDALTSHPLAVVVSCVDARPPTEFIFDLAMGDIVNIRVAGNVLSPFVLGSIEYACSVAGVKAIVVMGHTHCRAVWSALEGYRSNGAATADGENLRAIFERMQASIPFQAPAFADLSDEERVQLTDDVARRNALAAACAIRDESPLVAQGIEQGRLALAAAMLDVATGEVTLIDVPAGKAIPMAPSDSPAGRGPTR